MPWTAKNIPRLVDRVAVVTGANSGVGFHAARMLAKAGASVFVACRNQASASKAVRRINRVTGNRRTSAIALDLSRLDSVEAGAREILRCCERVDILCNNAGVMMCPPGLSADGIELQFAVNHIGHFALTAHLLPRLMANPGSRIVTVTSLAARGAALDLSDLEANRDCSPADGYGRSKLANLLFAVELNRRLAAAGSQTMSVAAHPGWSRTGLFRFVGWKRWYYFLAAQSASRGALPTVHAATASAVVGGRCYGPDGLGERRGFPREVSTPEEALNGDMASGLWSLSERLTDLKML